MLLEAGLFIWPQNYLIEMLKEKMHSNSLFILLCIGDLGASKCVLSYFNDFQFYSQCYRTLLVFENLAVLIYFIVTCNKSHSE